MFATGPERLASFLPGCKHLSGHRKSLPRHVPRPLLTAYIARGDVAGPRAAARELQPPGRGTSRPRLTSRPNRSPDLVARLASLLTHVRGRLGATRSSPREVPGRLHETRSSLFKVPGRLRETRSFPHNVPGRLHETRGSLFKVPGRLHETRSFPRNVPGRLRKSRGFPTRSRDVFARPAAFPRGPGTSWLGS